MHYDIFNGDADGIFSLHQYRLAYPEASATRITGVKRDIKLLQQIKDIKNSVVTVFDISLDSNRAPLGNLIAAGNTISYFDHHYAGEIPTSSSLSVQINPSAETCTSIIVNDFLNDASPLWAICGAYGDNLHKSALTLQAKAGISEGQGRALMELGELFNYNGYGATLADLHFDPADLYLAIAPYKNPFDFIENAPQLPTLRDGHASDMAKALEQKPYSIPGKNRVYIFPDAPWSRRVSGVFSNLKAREQEHSAHAIITENSDKTLRISVRAPLADRRDADTLCKSFPTGGGRSAAAGINVLPPELFESFLEAFNTTYP
ncbi:DHH family phosphoesterase [Desulforhopalus sp. 52FAK]